MRACCVLEEVLLRTTSVLEKLFVTVAKNAALRTNASSMEVLPYGFGNLVMQRLNLSGSPIHASYSELQHHPIAN